MLLTISVLICVHFSQSVGQNATNFICNNGYAINIQNLCNGFKNCPDGTDEGYKLCHNILCPLEKFRCHYGACILRKYVCDGIAQCMDGSDEQNCGSTAHSCEVNEFRCSKSNKCIPLNNLCDGQKNCDNNSDEGLICHKVDVCPPNTHRCRLGGCIHLSQRCDGKNDCIDGSDELDLYCNFGQIQNVEVYCPPINSNRMVVHCEVPSGPKMGVVACNLPMLPGTIAHFNCKEYYIPASYKHKRNANATCQFDGSWSREPLQCIPDCENVNPIVSPLIVHGWLTIPGSFAWHAVLFELREGKWEFMCGGTLITEKVIITAAHCTWEIDSKMLQVALGKRYSDFYKEEDSVQYRNISQIIRQPLYQDLLGNYGSDIAILVLEESIEFTSVVRPACIDWNLEDITEHIIDNNIGFVVGMGLTENNTYSVQLRGAYLPVVNESDCILQQKKDFKKYISYTSFCAGWRNGTGVCNGDSGGGLLFPVKKNPKKYTLQGIVSISPRRPGTSFCDTRFYTIFTKVGIYVDWIYDTLSQIHDSVKYDASKQVVF